MTDSNTIINNGIKRLNIAFAKLEARARIHTKFGSFIDFQRIEARPLGKSNRRFVVVSIFAVDKKLCKEEALIYV